MNRNPPRQRKYEFSLLVSVVGTLGIVLLGALEALGEKLEEATVDSETAAIRIELLDWLAHQQAVGGPLPESRNPLRWIDRQPAGYLGERDASPQRVAVWYFDRQRDELVYRFRSTREARFRLERGGGTAGVPGRLAGVGLHRVAGASDEKNQLR